MKDIILALKQLPLDYFWGVCIVTAIGFVSLASAVGKIASAILKRKK